jgi:uncharacterized membrane protein YccC
LAVFFLLLAIIAGLVVGDLVTENTAAGQLTMFGHTVSGYRQGWLLALAAALGFLVALLLVASVASRKTRRARRKELRAARRDMQERIAGLQDENQSLWDKLADSEETAPRHGQPARPADPRRDRWANEPDDRRRTVAPEPAEHQREPLYEQSRRAAGLGDRPDRHIPPTDSRAP